MNNLKHKFLNVYNNVVSSVTGPLKESKFYEEGKLTTAEYIAAGDFLVQKCPSWKWCASTDKLYDKNLPKDKQYLKTTVPCSIRAEDYYQQNATKEKNIEGDWVDAEMVNPRKEQTTNKAAVDLDDDDKKEDGEDGGAVDLDSDDDQPAKVVDDFEVVEDGTVKKNRTYDVSVTYDYYYCVPRMWLVGYNEEGVPLNADEMKQDIMMEYRNKTVTIDPHPCTGIQNISVHPCRHSQLLKKMIDNSEKNGKKLEPHMSILIFLKFLHSVVPTIQYDFTMDINF